MSVSEPEPTSLPAGPRWLFPLALALLSLVVFRDVLFRDHQFAFRDAAHFYYPLYATVEREWAAGRIPLWSPEENAGMPLLGNPTAAVLYPGKLVYTLFRSSYPWGARLYTISHVWLAACFMFLLLRSWSLTRPSATAGSLAYAFGGPVLFQNCNIIFLVGAAWTPLAFHAADLWLRRKHRAGIPLLALALAMQTTGGDPQAAYVSGLAAAGYALLLALSKHEQARDASLPDSGRPGNLFRRILLIKLVLLLWIAGVLACAAWFPTLRPPGRPRPVLPWMPHVPALVAGVWSILAAWFLLRAARAEQARTTILALVGLLASAGIAALLIAAQLLPVLEFTSLTLRASTDGPHEIYPFSVEPYRLLEFLWPNLWGTHHGRFRNWVGILPPVHVPRVWIPSLYLGATTLLFALSALQSSRSPSALELIKDPRRWMIWTAAASLLLAVGEFASPLWMARNFVDRQSTLHGNFEPIDPGGGSTPLPDSASSALRLLGRHDPAECPPIRPDGYLRDGDGSPYGLAAHLLPGFKQFRYPAKFLTFTALAITALAAMGLDRALTGRHRTALVIAAVLTVISLALVVAVTSQRSSILQFWANHPELKNNSNTGPFDPDGAYFELQHAFAHSGAFLFVTAILLGLVPRFPRAAAQGIVLLLGLDLAFEARHLVLTAPQSMLEGTPAALAAIQEAESIDAAEGPYRIHRMPYWAPLEWGIEGNPTRYLDYIAWERKTLQPKYLLPNGGEYTLTEGTAELFDFRFFFAPFGGTDDPSVTDQLRLPRGEKVVYFPRRAFDLWNSRYFVLPMVPRNDDKRAIYSLLPDTERITPASDAFTGPDGKEQQDIWLGEEDWQVRKNLHAYPRAWIVHEVIQYPPIQGMRRADRAERMYDILYQDDPLWRMSDRAPYDLKRLAFVESDNAADLAAFLAGSTSAPTDRVRITRYEPQRVELEATLHSPGLVVLADVFYPGWKLTIDGQPAPIHRANRLMRGAAVPKGTHTLVYTYEPSSFRVGLGLSALGLVAFLTVCAWSRLGSSRRMGPI